MLVTKRKPLAAEIREDAAKLSNPAQPLPGFYRLAESLCYEREAAALRKVEAMATQQVASIKALPASKLEANKDEAKRLRDALRYLTRWKILDPNFAPSAELDKFVKAQGWDKKKQTAD